MRGGCYGWQGDVSDQILLPRNFQLYCHPLRFMLSVFFSRLELCPPEHLFEDWIIAIDGQQKEGGHQLCVLLAHNSLCFYDIATKLAQTVQCKEKCILYPLSGNF